jgi:uncharacterized membrane protein YtjA (UPF0391 family)
MTKVSEVESKVTSRNVVLFFVILFLIIATVAVVVGAMTVIGTARGVAEITNPVGNLVRQLVVEATPVILPNPVIIVEEINSLARLETTSYSFQDVLQIERNQDTLFGAFGESLLFVAYGDVIAGVDLAKMQPEDLQVVSPTKVNVRLPEAEVFLSDLDNDRSYVADRDRGLFASVDPDLETTIRQEAEARMNEAALENGILEMADQEAQKFMLSFLQELGFEEIVFSDQPLPPIEPFVQELPKGFVLTPAAVSTPAVP